ncbi:MAG: hypothetical protein KC431_02050, partial [Myxococcales bacterium]|nr:hypothetical protein [Myxococcales bacterium]
MTAGGCAGSRGRGSAPPAYRSADELRGCAAHECSEANLELQRWADTDYRRGRLHYYCDPGSELDGPADPAVERMILVLHGQVELRDIRGMTVAPALAQLLAVRSAMSEAQRADESVDEAKIAIIAPIFQRSGDWQPFTDADPAVWTWPNSDFATGGEADEGRGKHGAVKAEPVSSFQVLDEFLRVGLTKFPNLKQIVIVGHSAGAQAVHRYALLGVGIHERVAAQGVALRYVVANPGMYAFPLRRRKLPPGRSSVPAGAGRGDTGNWRWDLPGGCKGYDDWGLGMSRLDDPRAVEAVDFAIDEYLRPV